MSPIASKNWAEHQLAEFLAAISGCRDEAEAVRSALDRAAEALDADAAAFVQRGAVGACIGFPAGRIPGADLVMAAEAGRGVVEVPGAGTCQAAGARMEGTDGFLVFARGGDPFNASELSLLHAMARVLGLTLRLLGAIHTERALRERSEAQARENESLLDALQHRQLLLERLSQIQSSIVRRVARDDVVEAIVSGAQALIGDDMAVLRLLDPADDRFLNTVAARGVDDKVLELTRRQPSSEGAGGRAFTEERLVVIEDYPHNPHAREAYASQAIEAAMAAPVRDGANVVGSLVVASPVRGRRYTEAEREALASLAEHASLALTDSRRVEEAIHQALHDPLTDLPNRVLFRDRLEHALSRRSARPVAVLFVDLDSFKRVNDTLGHAAGDRLLIAAGDRLAACARRGDTFARLGGDEFAMLVEEVDDSATPAAIAQRLLDALAQPFTMAGVDIHVRGSVGVAVGREDPDTLLRNADLAMYKAKARGRGRFELFDPGLHAAVVERVELEDDLRRALRTNALDLHYQPIVEVETGRVVSVEALLRWRHPRRGMVSPAVFVPVAEETGMIQSLGRWVLAEACRQAARWRAAGSDVTISVNLSVTQLQDPDIVDTVAATLRASRLAPSALVLEITETGLMEEFDAIAVRLQQLKALGVSLAVDDFGTGYSSLLYLDRLPIDVLKIDKLFVDGIGTDGPEPTLARAIINLGRSLGLRVVAEGIERPEQIAGLLSLGCTLGQGFHFHRPLERAAVEALLADGHRPAATSR